MNRRKKHIIGRIQHLTIMVLFMGLVVDGTSAQVEGPRLYRNITTDAYHIQRFDTSAVYREAWLEQEVRAITAVRNDSIVSITAEIPIVFHVLFTDDTVEARSEITFQMEALNRYFNEQQAVDWGATDPLDLYTGIEDIADLTFVLADESELPFPGVATIRKVQDPWPDWNTMKFEPLGSGTVDPQQFVNVWIVEDSSQFGSYAQFPGGPEDTDGIVIDHRYFGRGTEPYHLGKTLVHLMANYLGIIPLWGIVDCQDDGVPDTPVHSSRTFWYIDARNISACPGTPTQMVINFMDNTDDEYLTMWTKGQISRMNFMLNQGWRTNLAYGVPYKLNLHGSVTNDQMKSAMIISSSQKLNANNFLTYKVRDAFCIQDLFEVEKGATLEVQLVDFPLIRQE
ncbi:MAG: hypothetical protein KTR24_17165 [Saprospiraceae bacterium]|nr:hypothetical protein [Saprospiraceae bacterium]